MRYTPILKGKDGEYRALREASAEVGDATLPIIEALPVGKETVEQACFATVGKLAQLPFGTIAVDAVHLSPAEALPDGELPLQHLARAARSLSLALMPTVRLNDVDVVLEAVKKMAREDGRGAVLRIDGEDVQEEPGDLDNWLSELYRLVDLQASDFDVVLDLGAVDASTTAVLGRVARELINGLRDVATWRSLSVASGGFPLDLSAVPTGGTDLLMRHDARLFMQLASRPLERMPDYGDYAIQHPALPTQGGRGPAPQIRYTTEHTWRIRKGLTKVRRGHKQFYDICDDIVKSDEFAGPDFSWGDTQVSLAAQSAPEDVAALVRTGNATTWRAIGTSHHLATVVNRLATLGEP